LLRSGKFPRISVAGALLIAFLLLLDLQLVPSPRRSLLIANCLDLAIAVLAVSCCWRAAGRCAGYARQLWLLLTSALLLAAIAQAISTYYQSFVPGSAGSPWPSDVLFFVWAAPAAMILLPRGEEENAGIDALRGLDFLQIAILAATLYMYFFYSPLRWKAEGGLLLQQILMLYIGRDLLLCMCFVVRSRSARAPWVRSFFASLGWFFLAWIISDAAYLFTLSSSVSAASWGDLVWMAPFFCVIVVAGNWRTPENVAEWTASSRAGTLAWSQILPVAAPLLVIFMARAIAREQLALAWMAVAASVAGSSVRLILTNRRQRKIAENLLNTERALRISEETLSIAFRNSPDAFSINPFPNGPYLEVNEGYTRLTGYTREEALGKTPRQMNLWVDMDRRDQALAALRGSGHLRDFEFRFRTKSGQIRVGQMSASVIGIRSQRCSLVIVRDITERKEAEEILRSSEERFRLLVRDLHFAVVLHAPDARVEFANRATHKMFRLADGAAVGRHLTELGILAVSEDGTPLRYADHPVPYVLRTRMPIYERLMAFRRRGSREDLWLFGSCVPQLDANGNVVRVISSFADVTEMMQAEQAIHKLTAQLLKLQDEERRRLGRELHDGLAQTVLAINLSLAQARQMLVADHRAVPSLEKARGLTQKVSREIRTLSYLLHPPLLDDLGLVSTVKEYARGFSERSGIAMQLHADELDRLPQPIELALFRIVQESLTNIQRHSGTSKAEIRLRQQDSLVTLEVIDFGRGITKPPMEVCAKPGHPNDEENANARLGNNAVYGGLPMEAVASVPRAYGSEILTAEENPAQLHLGVGIPGMRERMAQLGGHLEVLSGPTGTTIRATISVSAPVRTGIHDAGPSHLDRG